MADKRTQIFRQSKANNYSIIHNEVLRRDDLSWKAKGIMCYILSLPDDWEIYLEELIKHSTDKKASFRSGWNELIEKGYVKRYPVRNERGKISEWRTEIRENVGLKPISPHTDFQEVENQEVDFQEVENQPLLSTNSTNDLSKQNTNKTNNTSNKDLMERFDLLWKEYKNKKGRDKAFTAYKRAIKSGVTDEVILDGIRRYNKEIELKKTEKHFIAHGSTWFNQKRWKDEYDSTVPQIPQSYQRKPIRQETLPDWAKNLDAEVVTTEKNLELDW